MRLFNKVTIIGVGLIGGSIGLAVKKRRLAKVVCGAGRRIAGLKRAKRLGAIDIATLDLEKAVEGAGLVIIATPISLIPQYALKIAALSGRTNKGLVMTDVGSTKEFIVKKLENSLPKTAHFVGSHPFAGSEKSSVLHATADLFNGADVFVTPTKNTNKTALRKIRDFWKALGADVIAMTAKRHDELVAGISHTPHIIAAALVNSASAKDIGFGSTGFCDTTRIASSDPLMWRDICLSNTENLLRAITAFKKNLRLFENALKTKDVRILMRLLGSAKNKREKI